MKCLFFRRYYEKGQAVESTLYGVTQDGNEARLFGEFEELTIFVKDGRYTIKNDKGEVFRQGLSDGTPSSILAIYDSTTLPAGGYRLETEDFSGDIEDYEKSCGHNRVERTERRRFVVFTEATPGESALGLIEVKDGLTIAIYSLYFDVEMSRRDKARYVVKYVYELLQANEYANINYAGLSLDGVNRHQYGMDSIKFYSIAKTSNQAEQPRLLFNDALENKRTITETFEEGYRYKNTGVFKEEVGGSEDDIEKTESIVTGAT